MRRRIIGATELTSIASAFKIGGLMTYHANKSREMETTRGRRA